MEHNKVIIGIIVLNVIFSWKGFTDLSFFNRYKFQVKSIQQGDRVRLLSSGFLHGDYMHLFFNMYVFYIFSPIVLSVFLDFKFIAIYILCLLFGNIYSLMIHQNNINYSAVGASGAVSGILYSAILIRPEMTLVMFPLPIPIPAYIFGIIYMLYSIYGMKKQLGNIGHSAHIGGAVCGFIVTLALRPSLFMENMYLSIGVILSILILYFVTRNQN